MKLNVEDWASSPPLNRTESARESSHNPNIGNEKAMRTLQAKHCPAEAHHPELRNFVCACQVIAIPESECLAFLYANTHCISSESSYYQNDEQVKELVTDIYKRYADDFGKFHKNPQPSSQEANDPVTDRNTCNSRDSVTNVTEDFFLVRTANQTMKDASERPIPNMLFGEFWFEGELCILFADTNLGKSILAVQIADSISRGQHIPGFKQESEKQTVLYFDFELSEKQFENRYSNNYSNHHRFSDLLYRIEINTEYNGSLENFEKTLHQALTYQIEKTGAKVLIIDNLTYLRNETERAKDALPLMKQLKALKNKYDLSILALAHTPKRDLSKPITRNDLQGSKMLINFCDSSFSIGESTKDKSLRYLKQIKVRACEHQYDGENVVVCEITKPVNFLGFEFVDFGSEREHLRLLPENQTKDLEQQIIELKAESPHLSLREIATALNTNQMKVKRTLDKHSVTSVTP